MKPCLNCIYLVKQRTTNTVILMCAITEKPCIKSLTVEGKCEQIEGAYDRTRMESLVS